MSPAGPDAFNHALHTANIWLADVGSAFGTRDRHYAQRTLRAWLHTLRDRLTVDTAAKFGAQLPELLRGAYYDGWEPNKVPIKYGVAEYTQRFAAQAGVPASQVSRVAGTITAVIGDHMSPGQLSEAFAELPTDLRGTIRGEAPAPSMPSAGGSREHPAEPADDRMSRLEDQVTGLTEAVRALAHGLEDGQLTGVDEREVSRAARLADEILMAASSR